MNPGYPQGQGYPGAPAPQGYPGGPPPQGAYQGGPPPQSAYQGGPPPQGAYPGGPGPAMGYQGGPPPQAGYPGAPAQAGAYPPPGGPGGAPGDDVQVQWKGEIPADDVDDNPNAAPAAPSAPPLEKMDTVAGYDHIGFDSGNYMCTCIFKCVNVHLDCYIGTEAFTKVLTIKMHIINLNLKPYSCIDIYAHSYLKPFMIGRKLCSNRKTHVQIMNLTCRLNMGFSRRHWSLRRDVMCSVD